MPRRLLIDGRIYDSGGLYTALLIKVLAYLLARRLQAEGFFSKLTITESMRKWRREEDLRDFLTMHFHAPFSIT